MPKKKKKKDETKGKSLKKLKFSEKLSPVADILTTTFDEIESRSLGTSVAGIPVNFYDFDALTQGLQRGSLVVLAGRPAMGKTSMFYPLLVFRQGQPKSLVVALESLHRSHKN